MSDVVPVFNYASIEIARFQEIAHTLQHHTSMEKVLNWMFAQSAPPRPVGMVEQDEFSFDFLLPWMDGLYLAYDTS